MARKSAIYTIPKETQKETFEYFLNNKDNRFTVICKKFGITYHQVKLIIALYLNDKRNNTIKNNL